MAILPAPLTQEPTAWPVGGPPAEAAASLAPNPMATHVKVVAILEIVWGGLLAAVALGLLITYPALRAAAKDGAPHGVLLDVAASGGLALIIVLAAVVALLYLLGGILLLKRKRSGKALTFIGAVLSLPDFPFGTAYGVYALVILTRPDTGRLLVD